MSDFNNSIKSSPTIATAAQLAEMRLKQWHQRGEALLTFENLRAWINAAGLVLFTPRPQFAAPSLVEAVLGAPSLAATLQQTSEARSLLTRLVAEGLAVPLNLLGTPGNGAHDLPDFVASTAVFSYVFTLRGDKAWKQPPATSGPVKVSNLALAIYEALAQRGPLSAYDLATEVGKEVTEAAVLRALGELWTHLRVLPLPQPDDRPTLWEMTSVRFTRQMKAGANAGQPSALSALISLYLGQAAAATEDEIETFLSPLAPRSRIRDVMHALLSARQLETMAIEGRTVIHVTGASPAFLEPGPEAAASSQAMVGDGEVTAEVENSAAEGGEAALGITKFVPKPRKVGTGYLAKAKPAKFGGKPDGFGRGPKRGFDGKRQERTERRSGPPLDRERRPFKRPTEPKRAPGFDKPWNEERPRKFSARRDRGEGEGHAGPKGERAGNKPSFRGEARPPRRDYGPRPERERQGERPQRRGSGFGPQRPFGVRPKGGDRENERFEGKPRAEHQGRRAEAAGTKREYRRFDAPRDRGKRPFTVDRATGQEGGGGFARKDAGGFAPRKFGKPSRSAGKPGGDKKTYSKKRNSGFAGKPGSPFAKFAGNKKPFGKRPPGRKYKPTQGESE